MQPFFLGQTQLYTMSIFEEFGDELEFVGFSQDRITNIIMNLIYSLYFLTLGAVETSVQLDNY